MRLRATLGLLLLALIATTSGCIENMEDLKEALGVRKPAPAPEPEPTYLPPVAKAQANATQILVGGSARFTSEGTKDPQGLALSFRWTFGNTGAADGAVVTHTFASPGDHVVTLTVTNTRGLTDTDVVHVVVQQGNRAPDAAFAIRDQTGRSVTAGEAGDRLSFDAGASSDPDNDTLAYLWTFGDGTTSIEPAPTHAYAAAGLYTVRLKVDDGTESREASRIVAINGTQTLAGEFTVASGSSQTHEVALAEGAQAFTVTLTFDAAVGANELHLILRDADGAEVARVDTATAPGTQGSQTRNVTLAYDALSSHEPGAWSVEVVRAKGVQVSYQVAARQTF